MRACAIGICSRTQRRGGGTRRIHFLCRGRLDRRLPRIGRTDGVISFLCVVLAQDVPNLGHSTRLLGVRDASGLLWPGLHQIGRHDEIENLVADLDCPAACARVIARGTRDPRPSVIFVTTREVPVGRGRPALLTVQGVGIPLPPVAANGDNRVPSDGRRLSGRPSYLPRCGLRCCSDDRLQFTFLRLRYHLGDVRGRRGCSRRGGSRR